MYYKQVKFNKILNYIYIKNLIESSNDQSFKFSNNYVNVIKNEKIENQLKNELNIINLKLKEIVSVWLPPNSKCKIHTDENRTFALIIPISNCDNFYFNWWTTKNFCSFDYIKMPTKDGNEIIKILDDENAILIDRLNLTLPSIVNVGIFHNVINESDNTLFALSLRFYEDINNLDEIQ